MEWTDSLTIKKRLFISNILMLIIPALVSILIVFISVFAFSNLFYKQIMDESVHEGNLSYMHKILVEQSKEFLKNSEKLNDSGLYHTVEKYLKSQEIKLQIFDKTGIVCSIGSKEKIDSSLISAMENLGDEGSVSANGACIYSKKISVDNRTYRVLIYNKSEIQESRYNEIIVGNIIIILCILIVISIIVVNRFLTKFIFKKIEAPLDILVDGVRHIRDGNLDFRIEYSEKDEFKEVCDDFNEMAERLKESVIINQKNEQNRKELIAGISHDLRTPLTSVKAYIEGLLEGVVATPSSNPSIYALTDVHGVLKS